ncbi:MAG: glycosyltransferase family 39 protein [Cyanobacteria bacterium J06648_16]
MVRNTEVGQLLRQVLGIAIQNLPQQQLGTHANDFSAACHEMSVGDAGKKYLKIGGKLFGGCLVVDYSNVAALCAGGLTVGKWRQLTGLRPRAAAQAADRNTGGSWLQPYRWELSWLIGGLLFRSMIAAGLLTGWDEAYYYLYTRHLSWSYFDHPVMVALTTGIGPWLTGTVSQLTIRLGTLGLYTGSLVLLYASARHLWGRPTARLTLAIATLVPLFTLAFGTLTAPDSGLICFGTLVLFWAAQEFFPAAAQDPPSPITHYRPTYRLALISLALGLACISKYHGFLLGLGLVMFCLTSPRHRRALFSPWLGLGLGLFAIALFPLWWWGLQTDWLSLQFHLGIRFESDAPTRYSLLQLLGVWGVGLAYLFPTLGLPLWWVSLQGLWQQLRWTGRWRSLSGAESQPTQTLAGFYQRQSLLLWFGLPIALGFTLLGGAKHIFPAWPAPGLWWLTPLLAYRATHWPKPRVRRWLSLSGWSIGIALTIAFLHITLGLLQKDSPYAPLGGFIAPAQDPVNELIDTVQLHRRLASSPQLQTALTETDFVFTNQYFLGGYFDMALHGLTSVPVTSFTQDPRGFAVWSNPAELVGQDAIYITTERYHRPEITETYLPYFRRFEPLGNVSTDRQGGITNTFYLYRATELLKPYEYPY